MAGSETVGRRGGAQHRGGNGRENSSDLSSSTSKKKQKDRANQESREAKKAAAAADGVIAEVKKGKHDPTCSKTTIVTTKVTAMCSHHERIRLVSLQTDELHCSYSTLVL